MSPLTLHLMRHAAPQTPGLLLGHMDMPPDPAAMQLCVERSRALAFDRLISSDLKRARAPAALIATARQVPHDIDARWRELHFGAWEGTDPATLPAEEIGRFWSSPDDHPPPGGESWSGLCLRVKAALGEIDRPSLVLTHAGAIRGALTTLCGFTYQQAWAIDLPYGALLSLRIWPGDNPSAQITGLVT